MATAQGIVEAYNVMRLDALGIARQDLAAGLDSLLKLRETSTVPWVSANLVRKSTGKPLFVEGVIRKVGELSVGITGITNSASPLPFTAQDDADLLAWQDVLPALIKRLAANCEMIVLLTDLPPAEQENLVAAVPFINLILLASPTSANTPPRLIASTLVCQVQGRGKYLGELRLRWQEKTFTYANEFIALQSTLPDDPEVRAIINKTKEQINIGDKPATTGQNPEKDVPLYVGWKRCGQCHQAQREFWQTTRHARAYDSLTAKGQHLNLGCVSCHMTVDREPIGQAPAILSPDLLQVGCEVCHGPGNDHVAEPRHRPMPVMPREETCRRCHTQERDDTFRYDRKRPLIACPKI